MYDLPMQNDPELSGKYLGEITQDFVKVSNTLKEGSYQLRVRKIAEYPIFPVSEDALPMGKLLIGRSEMDLKWNFYFSYLEEFVQRQIIDEEHLSDFLQTYRDPDEYCCLFVVDRDFVKFVYIPYPED